MIAGVLGLQLRAIVPPTDGSWYWPFMDYAMYRQARYEREPFRLLDMDLVPCDAKRPPRPLHWREVGLQPFRYRAMLARIAGLEPAESERAVAADAYLLDRLMVRLAGDQYCVARVLEETYLNDLERSGIPDVPRRPVHRWIIGSIADASSPSSGALP